MEMRYLFSVLIYLLRASAAPNAMITAPAKLQARQDDQRFVGYVSISGLGCLSPCFLNVVLGDTKLTTAVGRLALFLQINFNVDNGG